MSYQTMRVSAGGSSRSPRQVTISRRSSISSDACFRACAHSPLKLLHEDVANDGGRWRYPISIDWKWDPATDQHLIVW